MVNFLGHPGLGVKQMFWLKACPRCHGDLYQEEDLFGSYVACLQCGRELNQFEESFLDYPLGKAVGDEPEEALARAA